MEESYNHFVLSVSADGRNVIVAKVQKHPA